MAQQNPEASRKTEVDTNSEVDFRRVDETSRTNFIERVSDALNALHSCKAACVTASGQSKRGYEPIEDRPHGLTRVREHLMTATVALLPGEKYPVAPPGSKTQNAATYLLGNPTAVGETQMAIRQLRHGAEKVEQWLREHDGPIAEESAAELAKEAVSTVHREATIARDAIIDVASEHPGIVRTNIESTRSSVKETLPGDRLRLSFAAHEGELFAVSELRCARSASSRDGIGRGLSVKMKREGKPRTLYTIFLPPKLTQRPAVTDEDRHRGGENVTNVPLRAITRIDRAIR